MKTYIHLALFTFSFLLSCSSARCQKEVSILPPFEIHQQYPYISISKAQLAKVKTIWGLKNNHNNLHLEYKPQWVERYISVEIEVCQDGELKRAMGSNEQFTKAQKALMTTADSGKEIQVIINYWPKNNLTFNEPKKINFSFLINPENDAIFPGGEKALHQFLETIVFRNISADSFQNYDMTAIKFSIGPSGEVAQATIFGAEYQAGKFDAINQELLVAIHKMPRWKPATYADGTQTTQGFVLAVGSKENCALPLLNSFYLNKG